MCEVKPGLSETEVKLAFELIDSNKDSLIDVNEFGDWFSELKVSYLNCHCSNKRHRNGEMKWSSLILFVLVL